MVVRNRADRQAAWAPFVRRFAREDAQMPISLPHQEEVVDRSLEERNSKT